MSATNASGRDDCFIASITRTPIGRAEKGSLVDVRPDDLATIAVRAAVATSGIDPELFGDHICGTAYPQGRQGANLARRVVPLAGLPITVPGTTVNRFCSSSLQAMRMGAHAIWSGEARAQLISGVESISQVGRGTEPADRHPDLGPDGLADMYVAMGDTAENVADRFGVSRDDMDAFAVRSHQRAVAAQDDGSWEAEITPVPLPDATTMTLDDGPRRGSTIEKLASLKPVFRDGGSVTAGNSCPLNDGAAATVLVSGSVAEREGIEPMARIVASEVTALDPAMMGVGPIESVRRLLARTGESIEDIDVISFNEAFASQVIATARETGMDLSEQVNPRGGSLALGHPFGMTGIRLVATLLNDLRIRNAEKGLVTLCVGGGQGMAMRIDRLC